MLNPLNYSDFFWVPFRKDKTADIYIKLNLSIRERYFHHNLLVKITAPMFPKKIFVKSNY